MTLVSWNEFSVGVAYLFFKLYFYSDLSTIYDKVFLKENVKEASIAPLHAEAIIIEWVAVSPEQEGQTWSEGGLKPYQGLGTNFL